jgi:DNA-directed RNA polymerase II subunit RPB7
MLHPSYFGPRMQQYLESKLYSDVEGTCSGQFGFIIAVVSISDIGKGMVLSGNGQAEFITRYRAIVFKPFKGEVVDGVVHNVTRVRRSLSSLLTSSFACHSITVVREADPSTQMGIFAEVGPLNCFVSQQVRNAFHYSNSPHQRAVLSLYRTLQLLHPDLKFDPSSNPPSYTSQDQVSPPKTSLPPHSHLLRRFPTPQ